MKIEISDITLYTGSLHIEKINKKNHAFKVFYPHWIYFSDECKLTLIKQGFKVYEGEWMRGDKGLIIEW